MTKIRVLAVDDSSVMRELIAIFLSSDDFEVFFAKDGDEALEKLSQVNPQVIVSDYLMPHVDGVSFFKTLRHNPKWTSWSHTPLVLTTASSELENPASTVPDADYVLLKPLSQDKLIKTLKEAYLKHLVMHQQ